MQLTLMKRSVVNDRTQLGRSELVNHLLRSLIKLSSFGRVENPPSPPPSLLINSLPVLPGHGKRIMQTRGTMNYKRVNKSSEWIWLDLAWLRDQLFRRDRTDEDNNWCCFWVRSFGGRLFLYIKHSTDRVLLLCTNLFSICTRTKPTTTPKGATYNLWPCTHLLVDPLPLPPPQSSSSSSGGCHRMNGNNRPMMIITHILILFNKSRRTHNKRGTDAPCGAHLAVGCSSSSSTTTGRRNRIKNLTTNLNCKK